MKVQDSRHLKRERLRSGVTFLLAQPNRAAAKDELAPFFQREHHLCKLLAGRYAESTFTIVDGFPEGDAPEDVVESHVDALCFHDEETYAKRLFATDDLVVRVLRGTCTVTRRFYQWLDAGDIFTLGGRQYTVTSVRRETVAGVDEDEAKREGATSLAEWRRHWLENLPRSLGNPVWNGTTLAFRHEFVASDLPR